MKEWIWIDPGTMLYHDDPLVPLQPLLLSYTWEASGSLLVKMNHHGMLPEIRLKK